MKYLKILFIIVLIPILLFAKEATAQYVAPPITISKELVKIEGAIFYLHTVQRRETLFSISKAYEVTVDDIVNDNPKLSQGLKEGDYIYIRKADQPKTEETSQVELSKADQRRIKQEEREAARLAKAEERANSKGQQQIQTGQPFRGEVTTEAEAGQTENLDNHKNELGPNDIQTTHTVRWYESLSAIAKKYSVTEEEIALANSLVSNEISSRQQLIIPRAGAIARKTNANIIQPHSVPETEKMDESLVNIFSKPYYNQITISLQLPLGSNIDTTETNPYGNYIEFYQGFLLATNDLRKKYPNMDISLKTHDMTSYIRESEVLFSNSLSGSDLIIGPLLSGQQKPFIDFAYNTNAIFVSPIDSQSDIYTADYPNFFQITTPVYFQQEPLLSTLSGKSNVIMFYEDGSSDNSAFDMIKQLLEDNWVQYKPFSYNIAREGRLVSSTIDPMLSRTEKNHIVIASDSDAFVTDILQKLSHIKSQRKLDITVYGISKWRGLEDNSDIINYFHNLNLHMPVQYYVDYANHQVKEFVSKFRETYGIEPSPYAFQAYDIACYFIEGMYTRLRNSGGIGATRSLLQSDYNFIVKRNERGFTNTGVRLLIYNPDYSMELRTLTR
jgi:ABC-type branched-chain amino acid transport systems, periplasmic component